MGHFVLVQIRHAERHTVGQQYGPREAFDRLAASPGDLDLKFADAGTD
jgi:hypothetical protein